MAFLKNIPILKLIGWALLIHVILIALSITEVAIYAMLISPGQEQSFYEAHAQLTAPYISIIFGIILFFLIARSLAKKYFENRFLIAILLPAAYILTDVIILYLSNTDWAAQYIIFLISFCTKILFSYLGALSVRYQE